MSILTSLGSVVGTTAVAVAPATTLVQNRNINQNGFTISEESKQQIKNEIDERVRNEKLYPENASGFIEFFKMVNDNSGNTLTQKQILDYALTHPNQVKDYMVLLNSQILHRNLFDIMWGAVKTVGTAIAAGVTLGQIPSLNNAVVDSAQETANAFVDSVKDLSVVAAAAGAGILGVFDKVTGSQIGFIHDASTLLSDYTSKHTEDLLKTVIDMTAFSFGGAFTSVVKGLITEAEGPLVTYLFEPLVAGSIDLALQDPHQPHQVSQQNNLLKNNEQAVVKIQALSKQIQQSVSLNDSLTATQILAINKAHIQQLVQTAGFKNVSITSFDSNNCIKVEVSDEQNSHYFIVIDLNPLPNTMTTSAVINFPKLTGREMQDDQVEFQFTLKDITNNSDVSKGYYISTVDDHDDDGGVNVTWNINKTLDPSHKYAIYFQFNSAWGANDQGDGAQTLNPNHFVGHGSGDGNMMSSTVLVSDTEFQKLLNGRHHNFLKSLKFDFYHYYPDSSGYNNTHPQIEMWDNKNWVATWVKQ